MSKLITVCGVTATVFLLTLLCGCGTGGLDKALSIGGATLSCVEGEAPLVQDAIANGGANWFGIVMEAVGCIPGVVKSIIDASSVTASIGDLPRVYSKRALKRARVALRMANTVGVR